MQKKARKFKKSDQKRHVAPYINVGTALRKKQGAAAGNL
jgi:hypothetical protein